MPPMKSTPSSKGPVDWELLTKDDMKALAREVFVKTVQPRIAAAKERAMSPAKKLGFKEEDCLEALKAFKPEAFMKLHDPETRELVRKAYWGAEVRKAAKAEADACLQKIRDAVFDYIDRDHINRTKAFNAYLANFEKSGIDPDLVNYIKGLASDDED